MKPLLLITLIGCIAYTSAAGVYQQRFTEQYNKIKSKSNGYFSSKGVPYHSVETLVVEAPDYGHETTSEAYSYWIWMEAVQGAITGNYSAFNEAWKNMEQYIIPKLQQGSDSYKPEKPATYVAELDAPNNYPSLVDSSVPVGQDPLCSELESAYNTKDIYAMHWLLDVDNIYGFGVTQGQCETGPGTSRAPSFINTFQRGPMESVWRTVPQPTCDSFKFGGTNGFLDLFTKDNNYAHQWKYTAAPDADARAIQAAYWASIWANAKGKKSQITSTLSKAGKLGDYLRYSLYDKYFKKIGNCVNAKSCPGGSGKESAHYLLAWYFSWGGSYNAQYGWGYRIGDGTAHFGYQNPLTAWVLSQNNDIHPKGSTAREDWKNSLQRQLEFYKWLQTSEGAFAGGATNSWKGRYDSPPSNVTANTFHGMFYEWEPVYHDPPSNRWFGMQSWSADRLAQYYYVTGDSKAKALLDKWVSWVVNHIKVNGSSFSIPANLEWSGVPPNVHVKISSYGQDIGAASATARTLAYYAAKTKNSSVKTKAKQLMDAIWAHADSLGVSVEEEVDAYKQFKEKVYVPSGWRGKYPYGDTIDSSATFIGIRSFFKKDPNWKKVETFLNGGQVPKFKFHRFWAQTDIAITMGTYALLFNE